MRTGVTWLLALALQVSAFSTPLVHAHVDSHPADPPQAHADDHHHADEHERNAIHFHLTPHARVVVRHDGAGMEAGNSTRTVALQLYVAVGVQTFEVDLALPAGLEFHPPGEMAAQPPVEVSHGHDPPHGGQSSPRAPPALLS